MTDLRVAAEPRRLGKAGGLRTQRRRRPARAAIGQLSPWQPHTHDERELLPYRDTFYQTQAAVKIRI